MSAEDILHSFERTTTQFLSREEFLAKLKSGRQLRVKYAIDVKTSALHIGHAVNLWMLRAMQEAGHKAVIVFSDFTSRIGDRDGRLDTISDIPPEQIEKHISNVLDQAKTILRFEDPLIEIRRNSEWYAEMGVKDMLSLFSLVTHARLISRDAFQTRLKDGKEIHINELIYPILRAYDSYITRADISLFGSHHFFSESLGRFLQEKHKQAPQTLIATLITAGIDGRHKHSHIRGNDISLIHSPRDKFGRVMSIPDTLTAEYFRVYTDLPIKDVATALMKGPRDAKLALAAAIVRRYHGAEAAQQESAWFDNTISKGYVPDDLPTLIVGTHDIEALDLVSLARPDKSRSDSRRLIQQGGAQLNGHKLKGPEQELHLKDNDTLHLGKRDWFRIRIEQPPTFYTERLAIRSVHVRDIHELKQHIPQADVSKYIVRFSNKKKKTENDVKDAFKKIILQTDPKHEWLWMIAAKNDPDKVLGVVHLRGDVWEHPQNIWMAPGLTDEEGIVHEAMLELSSHALFKLDPQSEAFKKAFAAVNGQKDPEGLYQSFRTMDAALLAKTDMPQDIVGFTKEGWEQLQEWRRVTSPWLFKDDPRLAFNKKPQPKKHIEAPKPDRPEPVK